MSKYKYKSTDKLNIDYVECELCKKENKSYKARMLSYTHLKFKHNTSTNNYKKQFPNVYIYSKKFNDSRTFSKKGMIKRYGEKEGNLKFAKYQKRQAYTNSLEYFIEKYGKEEGVVKYNMKVSNQGKRFKNLSKDEKNKAEIKYRLRQAYTNSLEYFIEKYGKEEGLYTFNRINLEKGHAYLSYLSRYKNHEEATLHYINYCKIMQNVRVNVNNGSSKSADLFFTELYNLIITKYDYKKIFTQSINQEWFIVQSINNNKNCLFLDFFIKEIGKVIEYNGDWWHANPNQFKKDHIMNFPGKTKNITALEVWERDKNRLNSIKNIPYVNEILVIWESDVNKNRKEVLTKCIEFLKN